MFSIYKWAFLYRKRKKYCRGYYSAIDRGLMGKTA